MKTKLFLAALALPLVFGACSNDELLSTDGTVQKNGDLVEVGPNFVISATKGETGGTTRAAWEKNDANQLLYLWKPVAPEADGPAILDRIGLCWVGKTASDVVYTNYEFTHNGWLTKNELKADVDPCDGYVKNGYNFYDVTYETSGTKFVNTDAATNEDDDFLNSSKIEETQYVKFTPQTANNGSGETTYDMRSAFFKTSAQTLFGGDYIAYFPFNKDLKDEGCIPATSPVEFNVTPDDEFAHLSAENAMFAYGYAPGLVGGTTANDFSFYNLSGLIRVRLTGEGVTEHIEGVALVDADGKFISEVDLSAQKIIANSANPTAGKALYMSGTEKYTKMLSAKINASGWTGGEKMDIWFSALPTTTGALKIVVYNTDKKLSAVYNANAITVVPGGVAVVNAEVKNEDFTKNIAFDDHSLREMEDNGRTPITLLGDVRLPDGNGWTTNKTVTIEGGRIIVSAGSYLKVQGDKANIKSDILIEGQGCCGATPGKLEIGESSTGKKEFTFEGTIDNYGEITFVEGKDVSNKNVTNIKGNLNNLSQYIRENDDTQYGNVTLNKLATVNVSSELQNDGVFTINGVGNANEDGTLVVTGAVTNAYQMTNGGNINNNGTIANTAEGWFTDKIGSQFGGKQFDNAAAGQYICEVNGQNRLGVALNEDLRPTTRVRFTGNGALPSTPDPKKYNLKGVNSPNVDFEILSETDDIAFYSDAATAADVTIGDLIVTTGSLTVESSKIKTLKTSGISVDGADAKNVALQCNVDVTYSVVLTQMASGQKVTIGGAEIGSTGVYAETTMNVGGNFIVGDATPKSTKKAEAEFLNNNTTNITGSFDLNKNGTCTLLVATSTSADNYAAEVWCKTLNQNGGTWGNNSWPKVR